MKLILVMLLSALTACGSKSSASGSASASAAPSASAAAKSGRATLAVIRMADDVDLFPQEETADLPKGGSLLNESVPVGTQRKVLPKELVDQICGVKIADQPPVKCEKVGDDMTVNVPVGVARNYLRVVPVEGESIEQAIARVAPFFQTLKLPPETKIMVGKLFEPDEQKKTNVPVGLRTYVVTGDPVLTEKDVQSAKAEETGGAATVAIMLTPDAATRFEKFTGDNVMRRLAFVVDGNVLSAPVVQSKIGGGHLSIALSAADKGSDADKQEAARLAKALDPAQ